MLPPGTDALLGIGGTFPRCHGRGGVGLAEEYGFELVHSGVGEEEGGVVEGCAGGGGDGGVGVGLGEVVYECGSYFVGRPFYF